MASTVEATSSNLVVPVSYMVDQYYKIAEQYQATHSNISQQYSVIPTFLRYLGRVKDKEVLDLACGNGFFTRIIKQRGALKVVGVDVSKKMLDLAKKQEKKKPLGIKYLQYDVALMPKIGVFDLVSAVFLLHYASTKKELLAMCRNIYKNLKKDGRFITFSHNPVNPLQPNRKYDFTVMPKTKTLKEGGKMVVKIYKNKKELCVLTTFFWSKKTYEDILREAGFKSIFWRNLVVSADGLNKFGRSFWLDYYKQPGTIFLSCVK